MPNRIYAQYRDKPKAKAWYEILPSLSDEIETAYEAVRKSYDIDNNSGQALDVIGRVVVIDRGFESLVFFVPDTVFGSTSGDSQFGGLNAQFNSTGDILSQEVSDEIFKLLIKAKIAKNNNEATLDGIVSAISFITDVSSVRVIDHEDMTFSVSFGSELNSAERLVFNLFDILPRPQGVKFLGYTEETEITQFGGGFEWGDSRATFGQYFGA
jgi:hypothetical protein